MIAFQTTKPPSHDVATNHIASLVRPSPNPTLLSSDNTSRSITTHGTTTDATPEDKSRFPLLEPDIGPDSLQFRPLALRPWFLVCTLSFNFIVIGLLAILFVKGSFDLINVWAYFVIQFLPIIIGTATASSLEAIIMTLSRITPFMRCANDHGDTAKNTIFKEFVPLQGFMDALGTRNWLLAISHFYSFLAFCVQGLKASLLSMDADNKSHAYVTFWALYTVSGVYILIEIYIVAVFVYLYHRPTGLREGWDIVTIADHLALFRHSNFLAKFEGACIADRDSMVEVLGSLRLRLGYWRRDGDALWYGFGEMPTGKYL
ncbi:hypothetical protein G7Z17_g4757 [Cylindrodendrum hubeiense]|uniref:Uncharacterized protein n=1 Tax=Cylindrodendrum hubeiense TaxID=595255 RepID=A0A9P5HFI1_9HYPO|nr:hypothetical protein G7Z17_g4757 [Cylindrodendrum hubeiense]